MKMQSVLRAIYPPSCLACVAPVEQDFGLCPECWRETEFIAGCICDLCGAPLPGQGGQSAPPTELRCDDCLTIARPWQQGRAALRYGGTGRQLVLALKHGDRPEIARPAAGWIHRVVTPFLAADPLILPVPIHWRRLLRRRYNQSALLSKALAQRTGLTHIPDLLIRARATPSQDGRDREARFANLSGAISVDPRRAGHCRGRAVLIVDDVMTSGATLAAASEACLAAGAERVFVATLARVAKDA